MFLLPSRVVVALIALAMVTAGCAKSTPPATVVAVAVAASGLDRLDIGAAIGPWAPDANERRLVPVGQWLRAGDVVAWSYVDAQEGLSVRWESGPSGSRGSVHIRRISWAPANLEVVTPTEQAALGLPERPEWLDDYGPQPPAGTLYGWWRLDPDLAHRFHPEFPDDMRVVVGRVKGDGSVWYEVVWTRVVDCEDTKCRGTLLNQPDGVPALVIHDLIWFDLAETDAERLPVAAAMGTEPAPELTLMAATSAALAGILQDRLAWTTDPETPPEDRLVPVGRWAWVGDELAYFFLWPTGPAAAVVNRNPVGFESLVWAPRGMRLLSEEERVKLGLPQRLEFDGMPPQPEPGPWGTWRIDPAMAWLFENSSDPDVVLALLPPTSGPAEVVKIRIMGCDELRCWGPLLSTAGTLNPGAPMQLRHTSLLDEDGSMLPIAWPLGQEYPLLGQ